MNRCAPCRVFPARLASLLVACGLIGLSLISVASAEMPKSPPKSNKLFAAFEPGTMDAFKASASAQEAAQGLDQLIIAAATEKKLTPTPVIGDEAFLRRVTIDLLGRIPTAGERAKFIADKSDDRRTAVIRKMLTNDRFVQRLGVFFGDILRVRTTQDSGEALHAFLTQAIREKMPYDKMVRTMLTARGPLGEPSVGFLVAESADPLAMPGVVAQEFLGIRMSCAQCHDHPFDSWSQEQYYGFAAYFGRMSFYQREKPFKVVRVGIASESSVMWPAKPDKDHPAKRITPAWPVQMLDEADPHAAALTKIRTKKMERPPEQKAEDEINELIASPVSKNSRGMVQGMETDSATAARIATGDTDREALADLITSPRNRFFAWHVVNRLWAEFVGTPIVDPVDDFRSDNPPSNPRLLNRLADEFVASGYDLRFIIETILSTQAYQRQSLPGGPDVRKGAERAFVAAPLRRMSAETIYDSLVVAGHLSEYKHPAGENMTQVTYTVTERRLKNKGGTEKDAKGSKDAKDMGTMMAGQTPTTAPAASGASNAMMAQAAPASDDPDTMMINTNGSGRYSSEQVEKRVNESFMEMDRQAARESEMVAMMASEENVEYVSHKVTEVRDENPQFGPANDMASPAPSDHMLRQFGQPARATLGESRDRRPNTRQSLILLNGRLVNEAARVGSLEPMGNLMGDDKPISIAIELAYIEALTRKPTPAESQAAVALINAASNRRDGIADLRWVLLNSLEFRYVP